MKGKTMGKKNLYPKIEQMVKIGHVIIGDTVGLKFKGLRFSPNQAKLLTAWQGRGIEIKMTLQQNEGELFDENDDTKPDDTKPDDTKPDDTKPDKKKKDDSETDYKGT